METIIYKGVEIVKMHNTCYVFYLNNTKHTNTNLHFAKVMISKNSGGNTPAHFPPTPKTPNQ